MEEIHEPFNACKSSLEVLYKLYEKKEKEVATYDKYSKNYANETWAGKYDSHKVLLHGQQYVIEQINRDIGKQSSIVHLTCNSKFGSARKN